MTSSPSSPSLAVDITNCDKEPIHIPGFIQPHGVFLALQEPQLEIVQVSANTQELLGQEPLQLLGQPLSQLLASEQIDQLQRCLSQDFESVNPLKIVVNQSGQPRLFDGIIHRQDGLLILELEPSQSSVPIDFFGFYHLVRGSINRMQQAANLSDFCDVIVREVQQITGFERVMVYRFSPDGSGQVIAEAALEDLSPYLGLCYPASDIPRQARQLYQSNLLRLIPDVGYQAVPLIPARNPLTDQPTNLSAAVLRSVSPIHLEYLTNMGVGASMSISLIRDQKLWGLIACHHRQPRFLTYEIRTACEFLGQVTVLELGAKENNEDLDYKFRLKSIQSQFIEALAQEDNLLEGLTRQPDHLLNLVGAQGVAVCTDNQIISLGTVPRVEEIQALVDWTRHQIQDHLFYTDALPNLYPQAQAFQTVASGLLALAISKTQRNYILWFRPEVPQTVEWGGNPHKPLEVRADGELYLSPRKSFERWQESVRSQSLPWKACEIDGALELRSAIVGIVLRKADQLAEINTELERSNNELDAFAYIASHDLKEPLRGIHNYSNFLIEDYGHILNEDGVSKLQTLVRLTQRMEDLINSLLHFSRLGRIDLTMKVTDLNELVQTVIDVLRISSKVESLDIRIPQALPAIACDRIQVSEVFTNLISNALKYNNKPDQWVEIGYLDPGVPEGIPVFYVRDNGIGIPAKHLDNIFRIFKRLHAPNKYGGGTGAGLTIAKKIVERHGGKIWVESIPNEGSTFYFTLQAGEVDSAC